MKSDRLERFLFDDGGQAITEYVLILSVAVIGAAALARVILKALDQGVLRLGGELEKNLKTGRTPVSIWK